VRLIVEARGIHKHFGALHVLRGVDLAVAERELVFVIGPSGSGKSTLLRCLNRLEEPSAGRVVVDGIDMLDPRTDINHARQRIGMVFQSFNLYPHMTALGNVTLALRKVAGKSRADADTLGRAALTRVGLADRAAHTPGQLSGGQQQRVAIARAIALEPRVMLFDDSVAANIAYASDASPQQLRAVAEAANAWEFIERLPRQLDTPIGENGSLLSGGQRQRLAIARAMLKDAPILILDEATAALDTESERLVQDALNRLMPERTTLVIAHRLSTIEHADQVLVLDHGRLVEQGTHAQLLARGGLYAHLHRMQFREPTEA